MSAGSARVSRAVSGVSLETVPFVREATLIECDLRRLKTRVGAGRLNQQASGPCFPDIP